MLSPTQVIKPYGLNPNRNVQNSNISWPKSLKKISLIGSTVLLHAFDAVRLAPVFMFPYKSGSLLAIWTLCLLHLGYWWLLHVSIRKTMLCRHFWTAIQRSIIYAEQGDYVVKSVRLSVCLCVPMSAEKATSGLCWIFWTPQLRIRWVDFGGDSNHDLNRSRNSLTHT